MQVVPVARFSKLWRDYPVIMSRGYLVHARLPVIIIKHC